MTHSPAAEPELLATAAALLDTGQDAARLSRPLTVLAFAGLLAPFWTPVPPASVVLLLLAAASGLGSAYAAARVALDAALFRYLSLAAQGPELLDTALLDLRMLPAEKAGRPLTARIAGARRLLRVQFLLLAAQALTLAAAGLWRAAS